MIFIKLAWRNIWRNKRRTLITVASIFFAVSLSTIMRSLLDGVYDNMIRNITSFSAGYVQVHKKGYWTEKNIDNAMQADKKVLHIVESIPQVTAVMPRIETFALASVGSQTAGVMLFGIDPAGEDKITQISSRITAGSYLLPGDDALVIGSGLAKRLQVKPGDTMVVITQGYHAASANYMGIVKGIVSLGSPELDKSLVYLPVNAMQELLSLGDMVTGWSVMINSARNLEVVRDNLYAALDTSVYEVMDWKEMMPEIDQMIEADSGGHKITMAVLYLVISFGVFSTVLMMMAERRREFAIMIAIGLKKYQLAIVVFTETILLLMLGIITGTLASWPILEYFTQHPIQLSGELKAVYESYGFEPVIPVSKNPVVFLSQVKAVLIIGAIVLVYPMVALGRFRLMKAMHS